MNRIATAAVIAFASLGAVANAASVPAGSLMSNRDLSEANLTADARIEVSVGKATQVRAGDVMSVRELTEAGLSANDILTVGVSDTRRHVSYDAELR